MSKNPVVVPVLGQVYHVGEDLLPGLEGFPKELKHASGNLGVSYDVVLLSDDLRLREIRDLRQRLIDVRSTATAA